MKHLVMKISAQDEAESPAIVDLPAGTKPIINSSASSQIERV